MFNVYTVVVPSSVTVCTTVVNAVRSLSYRFSGKIIKPGFR